MEGRDSMKCPHGSPQRWAPCKLGAVCERICRLSNNPGLKRNLGGQEERFIAHLCVRGILVMSDKRPTDSYKRSNQGVG